MKKTWKWILGIIIILVVISALVAVPFAMRGYMLVNNQNWNLSQTRSRNNGPMMDGNNGWQHPLIPGGQGDYNYRSGPMMGGGRGFNNDFHSFNRFSPFGFGFQIVGGVLRLIPLALFALLLYGVYQLGKRSGKRSSLAPAPVYPEPAPATETTPKSDQKPIE